METQYENSTSLIYYMVNSSSGSSEEQRHIVIYWIIYIILVSGVVATTAYILLVLILKELREDQSSGKTHGTGSLAKLSKIAKIIVTLLTFIESAIALGQEMTTKFYYTENHCYVIEAAKGIPWIAIFAVVLLLQTSLLLLFSYPLYKHRIEVKFMNNANTINILPVLQRALFATVGFVLFSGMLFLVSGVIADGLLAAILRTIGSFSDFTFMIISFPNWRSTVMPCWKSQTRAIKNVTSTTNTTQSAV
ncbi:uncharacterized protein LOC144428256 [Styela clava]